MIKVCIGVHAMPRKGKCDKSFYAYKSKITIDKKEYYKLFPYNDIGLQKAIMFRSLKTIENL